MNKILLIAIVLLVGCSHKKKAHENVKVEYRDGGYCYHDDNMIWYWLWLNNSAVNTGSYQPLSSSQLSQGTWIKGSAPAKSEIEEKEEPEQEVEISQEQTEQAIPAENSLDSMEGVEAPAEGSSSGDSGSSGGDSGGGGGE